MSHHRYRIRVMNREEINLAIEWAAEEGWNPGLHDAQCYFSADPHGFLIGLLDDEPIATLSVIKYDDSFGFLGFYIVKPEYRGKGHGIEIWKAGINYLQDLNIGLDGVVDQQENYRKSGFKLAYRNIRYQGVGGGDQPRHSGVVELSTLPFDMIEAYDQPFFPANRAQFTRTWISQPDCHALGIMQNGTLSGYGVIRKCRDGYKIGPLMANSPELAESLFLALKAHTASSEHIYLDVPETNQAAVALAEKHGMNVSFETARMYTGAIPDIPLHRLFGVTSFEIG
ncbi:GNAT family N-acetyltransferase [Oceanimonas doudoroffii]|uniref:GNAT family N-acetyltransferase n=1 Tax=Oceanimonas doudoroffii TaxID=84158 RepID=A0A233RG82_9GAMM|nr:GNAT family N-acetyltransferase [Oceanimonas doudoroffii]OXY82394.1 GNAT family N-acetyltransferase [Oceanimonas doudoroffii]